MLIKTAGKEVDGLEKTPTMKKFLSAAFLLSMLTACGDSNEIPATQNDGINTTDSNGALADTTYMAPHTAPTDTSKGEHRVDISGRDTFR